MRLLQPLHRALSTSHAPGGLVARVQGPHRKSTAAMLQPGPILTPPAGPQSIPASTQPCPHWGARCLGQGVPLAALLLAGMVGSALAARPSPDGPTTESPHHPWFPAPRELPARTVPRQPARGGMFLRPSQYLGIPYPSLKGCLKAPGKFQLLHLQWREPPWPRCCIPNLLYTPFMRTTAVLWYPLGEEAPTAAFADSMLCLPRGACLEPGLKTGSSAGGEIWVITSPLQHIHCPSHNAVSSDWNWAEIHWRLLSGNTLKSLLP